MFSEEIQKEEIVKNMNSMIYIADNENDSSEIISSFLEREGFVVQTFLNRENLLSACAETMPDLVILDVMIQGMDGLSICSELRHLYPKLLIIIVSERVTPYDRVTGFSLGCDDYLIKPFLPMELVFRVRTLLKSSGLGYPDENNPPELTFGPLVLYPGSRTAQLDGAAFSLSPTEFDFLAYLISHHDTAVSREELLKNIWEVSWDANTRVADDLVKRLRRKFRAAHSAIHIETVWGYGFRISLKPIEKAVNAAENIENESAESDPETFASPPPLC